MSLTEIIISVPLAVLAVFLVLFAIYVVARVSSLAVKKTFEEYKDGRKG